MFLWPKLAYIIFCQTKSKWIQVLSRNYKGNAGGPDCSAVSADIQNGILYKSKRYRLGYMGAK